MRRRSEPSLHKSLTITFNIPEVNVLEILIAMGCRASKDGVAEPQPTLIRGCDKEFRLIGEEASKSNIQVISDRNSVCVSSLHISSSVLSNPPSTFFYINNSDEDTFSDEDDSDLGSSFTAPFKRVIGEDDENAFRTTALAALIRGMEAETDKMNETNIQDVEKRIEVIVVAHDEELGVGSGEDKLYCSLSTVQRATSFPALMSTSPMLIQQHIGGDIMAREETDTGELLNQERTHVLNEYPLDQLREPEEPEVSVDLEQSRELKRPANIAVSDLEMNLVNEDSALALSENHKQEQHQQQVPPAQENLNPKDTTKTNETAAYIQDKMVKKLPPLTMDPPIPAELQAHTFKKAALLTVVKCNTSEGNLPMLHEDELVTAQGLVDTETSQRSCEDNLDLSKWSPLTEHLEDTPTPATKSPTGSEWRSPSREMLDPDIEDIVLMESPPELHTLPLPTLLDCYGIHMDNRDLIGPSLRLIS